MFIALFINGESQTRLDARGKVANDFGNMQVSTTTLGTPFLSP